VRGGGNTPWAGAANIAGGVTIDLRALNNITLSPDQKTVQVGYGLSCDSVEAYDLVTANGTIETISATNKPDLYRPLKCGSSNYGVVVAYHLRNIHGGDFRGGSIIYTSTTADEQITTFAKLADSKTYDPYAAFIQSFAFSWPRGRIPHHHARLH
jgi:FAD/FMN-containing dehydrogenase